MKQPGREDELWRLRMQRLTLPIAASALTVVITLLVAEAGYVPFRAAAIYTGLVGVLSAALYALHKTGRNRWFSDPSLTIPQLVAAGLAVSYAAYEGTGARAIFMAMYLVAYMFGAFFLGPRGLIAIAAFYVACYAGVAGFALMARPEVTDPRREAFRVLALALLLGWAVVVGIYVSSLRQRLRYAQENLQQALTLAESRAREDGLTGCANRRRMMELLAVETKRAERGDVLTVCLLDLDHFKAINDEYGHPRGDDVLRQFAHVTRGLLRGTDFLARYGGEEFLIGLSQTGLAHAALVAERVRRAVQACEFPGLPPERRVTVSIGVAEHRPSDTIEQTLARVDAALYEAKRQGRNRVVCAG